MTGPVQAGCPVCGEGDGFHDKDKHAEHTVPREAVKPSGWHKCPLCVGWDEGGFPTKYTLCVDHAAFMARLDEIVAENRDVLGRLDDKTRLEFGESLLQMREGRGRTVRPGEWKGGREWIEYGDAEIRELRGEVEERGQG